MKDISFQDFKDMDDDNRWNHVWNVLSNHFHQIKEMKWVLRAMGATWFGYLIKVMFFSSQAPK